MKPDLERLIAQAQEELRPVRWPGRVAPWLVLWTLLSGSMVMGFTLWTGPLRPGALGQLVHHPQFLAESLLGLAAGLAVAYAALHLGRPGAAGSRLRVLGALGLGVTWALAFVVGWSFPALEPSMLGKRMGCELQTLWFSLPPLALGIAILRRFAPLDRAFAGALLGAASGALPALAMQLACMYDPTHALTHHLAPVLGVAALGALLGPLGLRRI